MPYAPERHFNSKTAVERREGDYSEFVRRITLHGRFTKRPYKTRRCQVFGVGAVREPPLRLRTNPQVRKTLAHFHSPLPDRVRLICDRLTQNRPMQSLWMQRGPTDCFGFNSTVSAPSLGASRWPLSNARNSTPLRREGQRHKHQRSPKIFQTS